ncbi:MAG: hypothetical protein GX911_02655, partial [Spirochaetales bacterium]|nr:hypothetical protein [Spirochaetales bacterium]
IFTVVVLGSLSANSPVISSFTLQGRMPEDQYFRIEVSTEAENVDLIEARGNIVPIGRYRLFSNVGNARFKIEIRPGEDGSETRFKLSLIPGTPHAPHLETEIPFTAGFVPYGDVRTGAVEGSSIVSRSVGAGTRDANQLGVQESGEIYAKIDDFDPNRFATGTYSSAIQFTVTTD